MPVAVGLNLAEMPRRLAGQTLRIFGAWLAYFSPVTYIVALMDADLPSLAKYVARSGGPGLTYGIHIPLTAALVWLAIRRHRQLNPWEVKQ